ncbi:MAG: phenylacetate-CoA oxygenase subunit PaaJ [Bacteroidetes bacterium]|nr:phenylacetate-CoA oxygenase subunit PaaJ [Bacteroidota bacterium]MBI3481892.1 phenylacetate-CoA oxygenase subunit PaaJ [Bacteroidota bacterium]
MTTGQIYEWLEDVKDPEIPVLSLVDLGVITEVVVQGNDVRIEMTPTFVGCPALDYMKEEVITLLKSKGIKNVEVEVTFKKAWTSDLITEKGKAVLKKYGLAPPPSAKVFADLEILEHAICPRCNNTNTELKTPFGPTLCRSIYYCNDCREAFEQFKPV